MSSLSVNVSFGALSPPIDEQLRDQGLKLDMDPLLRGHLQRDVDQVTRLRIRCILTEAESDKARKRIFQIIKKHAKPLWPRDQASQSWRQCLISTWHGQGDLFENLGDGE